MPGQDFRRMQGILLGSRALNYSLGSLQIFEMFLERKFEVLECSSLTMPVIIFCSVPDMIDVSSRVSHLFSFFLYNCREEACVTTA